MRSRFVPAQTLALFLLLACPPASASAESNEPQILFQNVNVFDGRSQALAQGVDVLVTGNLIEAVGAGLESRPDATVIDGGGRTLMPGLIDNHVHLALTGSNLSAIESMSWGQLALGTVPSAQMYLMEGFTTVRDAGGTPAALREAIDR
ncbi:MAG: amidohydrolase family protein, partial [Myxococcales bacterium]|nr:amidohydrolase family protein [Myxococcales bacterium]